MLLNKGLSSIEVSVRRKQGQINSSDENYTPGYTTIVIKNIFSVINLVITPLLILLFLLGLRSEVAAFAIFLVFNTLTSLFDEIRIKRAIAKLKNEFQIKSVVIRDKKAIEIPISEIVLDDLIKLNEGDTIPADGKVLEASFLQIDESNITGESDYIKKEAQNKLFAGSFVVTGECYYKVTAVGKTNFNNKLAAESTKFEKSSSYLQKGANKLITVLIISAIAIGLINYFASGLNSEIELKSRVLSVMSVTALVIPQTLIFLFTLTYSVSVYKLFNKGILVQKSSAIEELTRIDVVCLDKTGTITTNNMKLVSEFYNKLDKHVLSTVYNSALNFLFGLSKTQKVLLASLDKTDAFIIDNFNQIPFTSKNKYSLISGKLNLTEADSEFTILLGANEIISKYIKPRTAKLINSKIVEAEELGNRSLVLLMFPKAYPTIEAIAKQTDQVAFYAFEEELNSGIKAVLNKFTQLGIKIKVISGDSKGAVTSILGKLGLNDLKVADLSIQSSKQQDIENSAEVDIYTRATPEDKLLILKNLQKQGHSVAMAGDGINDVLSLKTANVSIAMESGAKVTRSIADIVLLKNDYQKMPQIFFEGNNIIFNLKLSTQMFLAKSVMALVLGLLFSIILVNFPIHPSTTLIFGFLSSSLPGYLLVFSRDNVPKVKDFFGEVYKSSLVWGIAIAIIIFVTYLVSSSILGFNIEQVNTLLMLVALSGSTLYSVDVLWRSKKLIKIWQPFVVYTLIFLAGTFQTILPIDNLILMKYGLPLLIAYFICTITAVVIIITTWGKRSQLINWMLILISFVWGLILIFPFRDYYHVIMLDFSFYLAVYLIGSLYFLFLLIQLKINKH